MFDCHRIVHDTFIHQKLTIQLFQLLFKDYLKTNIEKLGLKNDKTTQIAILNAHGNEKGAAERNYDVWGPHSFMDEYEWTKDGVVEKYEGFKNDKRTNKMKFKIIDAFEGQSEGDFNEQTFVEKIRELENPKLKKTV